MSGRPKIRIQEIFPFCLRDGIDVKPIVGNILFGRDSRTLQTVRSRPNSTNHGYESSEPTVLANFSTCRVRWSRSFAVLSNTLKYN